MNTEARLTTAEPENWSMKGHKKSQFKTYAKEKEGEKKTPIFKKMSPVFHGNIIKRIKFIYFLKNFFRLRS